MIYINGKGEGCFAIQLYCLFSDLTYSEVIGLMGTVCRITERGDVRVQYPGFANRWTFYLFLV